MTTAMVTRRSTHVDKLRSELDIGCGYILVDSGLALENVECIMAIQNELKKQAVPIFTCFFSLGDAAWLVEGDSAFDRLRLQSVLTQDQWSKKAFQPLHGKVRSLFGDSFEAIQAVFLENKKGVTRQQKHIDYHETVLERLENKIYFALVALSGETSLYVQPLNSEEDEVSVKIPKGKMIICNGKIVHSGSEALSTRIHFKILMKGEQGPVELDFTRYVDDTDNETQFPYAKNKRQKTEEK
jgi:hypothetical protein